MKKFLLISTFFYFFTSCNNAQNTQSDTNYTFSGKLLTLSNLNYSKEFIHDARGLKEIKTSTLKTITHVMAISPQTANPRRYITTINTDGSFNLNVLAGQPYVIVFIANGQGFKGPDMIAGIVKISEYNLNTLAPVSAGNANLGNVSIDANSQQATLSTSIADLLTSLGLTSNEATYLGSIDSLSLRAANPDIDGNGVIDMLENKNFYMDWHVRADTKVNGNSAKFSDAVNNFLNNPTIQFTLNSAYAVYPASFYNGICPTNSGVNKNLISGCSFDIQNLARTASVITDWPFQSYSGGRFGDQFQWGADFNPTANPAQEMPGSNGSGVSISTSYPNGSVLLFSNVQTRSIASLTADGTLLPFLQLNTSDNTSNGTMTSVDYKWMRLSAGTWVDATANEIALIVNSNGGYANFYTERNGSIQKGFSFSIPAKSTSGRLTWDNDHISNSSDINLSSITPNMFCNSAVSYDDKLGLRIFTGSFQANTGITPCP